MLRLGIRPAAGSTLLAILSISQLAQAASSSASSSNVSLSERQAGAADSSPHETPPVELHFGAKVALCLLAATIALVAVATLVDYQTSDGWPAHKKRAGPRRRDTAANGHRLLFGRREPGGLRDYRSLSMSSSCSSSLFCYTNSAASSGAHLGHSPAAPTGPQDAPAHTAPSSHECLAAAAQQQHYESNLRLHFIHEQAAGNVSSAAGKPLNLATAPPFCRQDNKPAGCFAYRAPECSASSVQSGSDEQLVRSQRRRRRRAELAALAGQILLAFSVRQSARQIFGSCAGEGARRCAADAAAPALTFVARAQNNSPHKFSCHARQAAAAAAADDDHDTHHDHHTTASSSHSAGKANATSGPHVSIDSLHGLRFLSMIWVIVIHSYNFALRWMFFSNATTLDSIYKSAASQLIANGSFACDSFFFAGGFLLPYSAFVADQTAPVARAHEEAGSKASAASPDDNNTYSATNQQVAPSASGAGNERLESGAWCCPHCSGCACCCCCCCRCCCCCCCCCARQQPQLHGCSRAGLASGAASQVHARASATSAATAVSDNISARPPGQAAHPCQLALLVNGGSGGPHACQRACCTRWPARHQQQQQQQASCSLQEARERARNTNEPAAGANYKRAAGAHAPGATSGQQQPLTLKRILANIVHRYARMMPLMMAIIGLCASLLRYFGDGPLWADSTLMYDGWCRKNWWINAMFLHNFVNRENMCLSHSWYSAVDLQLFLVGQLVLFVLSRSRRAGLALLLALIGGSQVITMALTLAHQLPAVPLVSSVDERTMNLYYGEIYIKPYCRASPYLIGLLLAYLMRTSQLERLHLRKWQVAAGWSLSLGAFAAIILAMQPAMNGRSLSGLESALYSALSRPLWALATGWMIFACITKRAGLVARILAARCFVPLSKLNYPAFLVHPIVMALFYGSRQSSFHFSHYLMLYLILGNIVITYASAFILAALFELPMLSVERAISRRLFGARAR